MTGDLIEVRLPLNSDVENRVTDDLIRALNHGGLPRGCYDIPSRGTRGLIEYINSAAFSRMYSEWFRARLTNSDLLIMLYNLRLEDDEDGHNYAIVEVDRDTAILLKLTFGGVQ